MMTNPGIAVIAGQSATAHEALLALNNAHAEETSFLSLEKWRMLIERAYLAVAFDETAALMIVFNQDADYDNANFEWFRSRYRRFAYVDRIIVSDSRRGRGVAGKLYQYLFDRAAGDGLGRIVCEVNLDPPNPGSDAFHAKMGFDTVGQAVLAEAEKAVRYLRKTL